jgi:hypothetical protein
MLLSDERAVTRAMWICVSCCYRTERVELEGVKECRRLSCLITECNGVGKLRGGELCTLTTHAGGSGVCSSRLC